MDFLEVASSFSEVAGCKLPWISCNVDRELLGQWGISEEELWKAAEENLEAERFIREDITTLIGECIQESGAMPEIIAKEGITELSEEMYGNMYVMTNPDQRYGAVSFLRKDLLAGFAEEKGCSFYILPSSIHEVILMPDRGACTIEELRQMVRQINRTQVERSEWLSDNVYYYCQETGEIKF